jgi:hypothetical protein
MKKRDTSLPATTTEQEDIVTAGQRKVNLIWEYTQSIIALLVVFTTMIAAIRLSPGEQISTILSMAFGTVVGFYFSRTNHAAIGGVGKQPKQDYIGR